MPASFYESLGETAEPKKHSVEQSVTDVTDRINDALSSNTKFVTFTEAKTGKWFSVAAEDVSGIHEP
jgi:hypothetical protein